MHQPKDRSTGWTQKQDPYIYCLQETHFRPKDTYRLEVRGYKNIFHANGKQKKAGVATLILDKTDLKIKNITRGKKGHYIMITLYARQKKRHRGLEQNFGLYGRM